MNKILNKVEEEGESFVQWNNLSVEGCKKMESVASELDFYKAASVYRDNVHKCCDYKNK